MNWLCEINQAANRCPFFSTTPPLLPTFVTAVTGKVLPPWAFQPGASARLVKAGQGKKVFSVDF